MLVVRYRWNLGGRQLLGHREPRASLATGSHRLLVGFRQQRLRWWRGFPGHMDDPNVVIGMQIEVTKCSNSITLIVIADTQWNHKTLARSIPLGTKKIFDLTWLKHEHSIWVHTLPVHFQ